MGGLGKMKRYLYVIMLFAFISVSIIIQNRYFQKQKALILETEQTPHNVLTSSDEFKVSLPNRDITEPDQSVNGQPVQRSLINSIGITLEERFHTPSGYQRLEKPVGSLQGYLRKYEMKPDKSPVLLYDGSEKRNQKAHAAVFSMPLVKGDLQQCADSVIRMYGEYLWSAGAHDSIAFHLTNGFLMEYSSWKDGKRLNVEGNKVSWEKRETFDDSNESFLKYLRQVMIYAGTISLDNECSSVDLNQILAGDLLIRGGSPGHCVMVVDVAEDASGNRSFLLAQGYMPAQEFQVLKNPLHKEDPWYYVSEIQDSIVTPEYKFNMGDLKRWKAFVH
jgi:hypothetical protein